MSKQSHILFAVELDGKGGARPLEDHAEIAEKLKSPALAWVHLNANHADTKKWLKENIPYLDDMVIETLTAEETRPRIIELGDGLLMNLRGVNLNPGEEAEDMVSLRIYIDPQRVISMRRRKIFAVEDVRHQLDKGVGPKDASDLLIAIMTHLFQRMEPVLAELDDRTDQIEQDILDNPNINERKEIVDIRKMAIMLRRYIAPQKEAVSNLRLIECEWIDSMHKRRIQENQDRLIRYIEDLDAIRDRAQIVKDEPANVLSDRMNKNMYVLSIVAAIFLPLSFLTGLLGINVGGLPGADSDNAFWIVCGLCALFTAVQLLLFRLLRWL